MREKTIQAADLETDLKAGAGEADATLRLIASLPAPAGLVARVQGNMHAAKPSTGRILPWPVAGGASGSVSWMRGAAAAAIVCVVAGGAWSISARLAPTTGTNAAAQPVRVRPAGGFSSAGAMRTPSTLNGPVLKHDTQKKVDAAKKNPEHAAAPDSNPGSQTK